MTRYKVSFEVQSGEDWSKTFSATMDTFEEAESCVDFLEVKGLYATIHKNVFVWEEVMKDDSNEARLFPASR